jgi:SAM-dependent methyltransferase
LEIGSNDGFLLSLIQERKNKVIGVDASDFMANLASSSGIKTIAGIFGESRELDNQIEENSKYYQLIIANNVLNHSNNPINFVKSVKKLLSKDGIFIFEVPYWLETVKSLHFDQIYHEHVTYFSVKAAKELLRVAGLEIIDVEVVNYHGGSLRITASNAGSNEAVLVEKMISVETEEGLFSIERYERYFSDIVKHKTTFMNKIATLKEADRTLFGIGAAAKANTLLTFYQLDVNYLDFIVDASEFKQGKITPVTKIPIFPDSRVRKISNPTGVVLAWNIGEEVKKNLSQFNPEVEFINV